MKSVEAKNGKEVAAKKTTPFLINVIAQRRERERKKESRLQRLGPPRLLPDG